MMDASKDYYAVLGVLPSAEDVVIRAAYKALAQRYHPDRFDGDADTAHARTSELNEAYAVLSDPALRAEYDALRGAKTQAGDRYFTTDEQDTPPEFDPLEKDWQVALKYYPDLAQIDARLAKISWRLAYSFRAFLLEAKTFDRREQVASVLEEQFLQVYFGTNPTILAFARDVVMKGKKDVARALNEAVRVLGSNIDAGRIIDLIQSEFAPRTDAELMREYGITHNGKKYVYGQYRYDRLDDAVGYAQIDRARMKQ